MRADGYREIQWPISCNLSF